MINYIEGKLAGKNPAYAVIECNGLGYYINISLNTFSALGNLNEKCKLYTHLAIKTEATTPVGILLYGFHSEKEREIFINLISVSGVGYNTARLILSSLSADETIFSIANGDVGTFRRVKGIGDKTAQKIIIELRDKIGKIGELTDNILFEHNTNKQEALSALILLGFVKNSADKALDKVIKEKPGLTVEALIKEALKLL